MNGFVYFLPGVNTNAGTHLAEFGLEHIADTDDTVHGRGIANGVDGKSGLLVANAKTVFAVEDLKFTGDIQWTAFPKPHAERQAFIGQLPGSGPVLPHDLLRGKVINGHYVTMGDRNKWLVPIARKASSDGAVCNLPLTCGLDAETGKLTYQDVDQTYIALWNHAEHYASALSEAISNPDADGNIEFSYSVPDLEQFLTHVFACNYRVSLRELTLLGVISTEGLLNEILSALMDDAGWEALKKSQAQDTGNG